MSFESVENARKGYAIRLICIWLPIVIIIVTTLFTVNFGLAEMANSPNPGNTGIVSGMMALNLFVIVTLVFVSSTFAKSEPIKYKEIYKKYFVEESLKRTFTDSIYNDHEINRKTLQSTGMIRLGTNFYVNDSFSGKYKDVKFSQADIEISNKDGNASSILFKGRWLVFEFPKNFNFRLEIAERGFGVNLVPQENVKTGKKIQQISTESNTFNRQFKVYAEDGFEAFYILDPTFIDSIEKLNKIYKGKFILCFIDNKLHVGVLNYRDTFEPPLPFTKLNQEKEIAKVSKEIKLITDFIDSLKLDKKLFKA